MEAGGPSCSTLPPLGTALQNEVQNEHNDDSEDNNSRGAKAQNVFHLKFIQREFISISNMYFWRLFNLKRDERQDISSVCIACFDP